MRPDDDEKKFNRKGKFDWPRPDRTRMVWYGGRVDNEKVKKRTVYREERKGKMGMRRKDGSWPCVLRPNRYR